MTNVTIIPARCGSKRLSGKNIIPLGGKPLIQYSIEYALKNKEICGDIFVSTDCDEIKNTVKKFPVEIHHRPENLSGDLVPTVEVLRNFLITQSVHYDYVILLQPTNPFRPENLLKSAFDSLKEKKAESLFTVTMLKKKIGKIVDNKFFPVNYTFGQRSQDMEKLFFENGLLYITKKEMILNGKIMDINSYPFQVNHIFAQVDIDTKEDLLFAEFILKNIGYD